MARLEPKSPTEVRDYELDWSDFLGADTIETSTVTVDGVTLDSTTNTNSAVTVWVSGGATGTVATITNTIETAAGRTEVEVHSLPIQANEPITLTEVKAYLRVMSDDEDAKIRSMIPRARAWVEDHTGLALVRRPFTERRTTANGAIRLFKSPLVTLDAASADGVAFTPRSFSPASTILAGEGGWPSLASGEGYEITYTAGFGVGEVDERLIGAMLALIEGEYAEGYAYPPRSVEAAERCCGYLRVMAV